MPRLRASIGSLAQVSRSPRPREAHEAGEYDQLLSTLLGWVLSMTPTFRPRHTAMNLGSLAKLQLYSPEVRGPFDDSFSDRRGAPWGRAWLSAAALQPRGEACKGAGVAEGRASAHGSAAAAPPPAVHAQRSGLGVSGPAHGARPPRAGVT